MTQMSSPQKPRFPKIRATLGKLLNEAVIKITVEVAKVIIVPLVLAFGPKVLSSISASLSRLFQTEFRVTIGQALAALGIIFFVCTATFRVVRLLQSKRKVSQSTVTEKKEFYSAIWEIGDSPDTIEGPLCKRCLLQMEPHWENTGRYSRGLPFITHFVCEWCGATTENHPKVYYDPSEIKERVYELHRADKRRDASKKSL